MAKSHTKAFIRGQYNLLVAKDAKSRLNYIVAGVKDNNLITTSGEVIAPYEGEDCMFITEDDTNVSRLSSVRLNNIKTRMENYLNDAQADETANDAQADVTVNDAQADVTVNDAQADVTVNDAQADVTVNDDVEDDTQADVETPDYAALEKACKKAIKKGNAKKAFKILTKLENQKCYKKLFKKAKEL